MTEHTGMSPLPGTIDPTREDLMMTTTTDFADLNDITARFIGCGVFDIDPNTGRSAFAPSDSLPCDRCTQVHATVTLGVDWTEHTERLCAPCAQQALTGESPTTTTPVPTSAAPR